jgi:hypothetical protein
MPTAFTLNGAACSYVLVGASGETRRGGPPPGRARGSDVEAAGVNSVTGGGTDRGVRGNLGAPAMPVGGSPGGSPTNGVVAAGGDLPGGNPDGGSPAPAGGPSPSASGTPAPTIPASSPPAPEPTMSSQAAPPEPSPSS